MGERTSLLRRIARPPVPPPSLTPARALRLATTRAAERSIGLALGVLGVAEEEGLLDDLLSRLEEGLLVIALAEGAEPVGLAALDLEARAAIIEMQTLGRVASASPESRGVTAADVALAHPFLSSVLREIGEALVDTRLAGWLRGPRLANRLPSAREAMMYLPDGPYRIVRLTLDLGAGVRQGQFILMVRLPPAKADPEDVSARPTTVGPQAMGAPTSLRAVLHRLSLPLDAAEALEVGQVLALPGVTVASVRIEGGGQDLGPARLGQVAGIRAIRLEAPLSPELHDIPSLRDPSDDLPLLGEG